MVIITTALTSPLCAWRESSLSSCMLLIQHVKKRGSVFIYVCIYASIIFSLKIGMGNKISYNLVWLCVAYTGKSGIKTDHISAHLWTALNTWI